ncbi:MAG: four helix bundle protein [Acidobacteriaceae bacterium]|nr:four helix bundle protein [Acidobacteriaceae bacterium]
MQAKTEQLRERTRNFAVRVLHVCRALPYCSESRVVGHQLLRSATSVAANYRAVCKARSPADFISKLGIVEEECDETIFWLKFLVDAGLMKAERLFSLIDEAKQLAAIFAASRRTAKAHKSTIGTWQS